MLYRKMYQYDVLLHVIYSSNANPNKKFNPKASLGSFLSEIER